jgi:hypothetical protein
VQREDALETGVQERVLHVLLHTRERDAAAAFGDLVAKADEAPIAMLEMKPTRERSSTASFGFSTVRR